MRFKIVLAAVLKKQLLLSVKVLLAGSFISPALVCILLQPLFSVVNGRFRVDLITAVVFIFNIAGGLFKKNATAGIITRSLCLLTMWSS